MAPEKLDAIVLRTTDWSETSRIATLWTRELGKVRALAKGGRRLKSSFESALDLLTHCSIVLLRKSSGSLDLLTEAQVVERFPRLRSDLGGLYAAYYVAELLSDWTEDYDPHPVLFDDALTTLRALGAAGEPSGPRLARFEMVLLRELGYSPTLESCASCGGGIDLTQVWFSAAAGGIVCPHCRRQFRDARAVSADTLNVLRNLGGPGEVWRPPWPDHSRAEVRQVLNQYITYTMGRQPRLLPYLGS